MVPEPDNPDSCAIQNFCPLFIVQPLLVIIVPSTIKLNCELGIMAIKVEDITTSRMLSTELITQKTSVS